MVKFNVTTESFITGSGTILVKADGNPVPTPTNSQELAFRRSISYIRLGAAGNPSGAAGGGENTQFEDDYLVPRKE